MKKTLFVLLFILCLCINVKASEQLPDGWNSVKNITKNSNCSLTNVWGYYKDGVEIDRQCRLYLAHRGWGDAPENSLAAFKMVKEKGYKGFELDVRFTKDNVMVVSHDATINRVGRNKNLSSLSSNVYIKDLTYNELKEYVFPITRDGRFLNNYTKNKITTLEEAVKYAKDNRLYIAIELKEGTAAQIKKIVQLVQKYKMTNSVRYLSFNVQLVKMVKDVDPTALLSINDLSSHKSNGVCEPDFETRYCKSITVKGKDEGAEQRKYFHELLDTGKNHVIMSGKSADATGASTSSTTNLPENAETYPKDKYKLDVIKKGTITVNKLSVSMNEGEEKTVSYAYNGDGTVKCTSSNKTYATCSVNKNTKQITIKGLKEKSVTIKVYATQGTKYSATVDYTITVKVSKKVIAAGDVNGDGIVTANDYILVKKHIIGKSLLQGETKVRADVNSDGTINATDYVLIKKMILNRTILINN